MRLPFPYRRQNTIVRRNVDAAAAVLDWPQVIETARPWWRRFARIRRRSGRWKACSRNIRSPNPRPRADAARRGAAAGA